MKKITSKRFDKIWGYELWVYSHIKGSETSLEDWTLPTGGPLVKIIQANQPLSVQVHPDDKMAKEVEGLPNGKSESWVILDAVPGAELIVGMKSYDKDLIRAKIKNGTFEDLLIKVKVKKGEFYNVPAGLVHGIGAGIKVAEVQQSSDTTYRYYDYNRLGDDGKPRALHIEKALAAQKDLSYNLEPISRHPLTYKTDAGIQIFVKEPTLVTKKTLVINLDTEESFIAKDELVSLTNAIFIPLE